MENRLSITIFIALINNNLVLIFLQWHAVLYILLCGIITQQIQFSGQKSEAAVLVYGTRVL